MERVREAVLALPGYFDSHTNIEGVAATDLFALNTVLGATIEVQVVQTLNRMRDVWDPEDEWPLHVFERQAQTFPDVLLRSDLNAIWQDLHARVRRRLDRDVEARSADAMQSLGRVVEILGGPE